jgi:hypothetical protein
VKEISVADAAWAAGFLDGEGSFTIRSGNHGTFTLVVEAGQIDPRPLLKLREMFGGSVRLAPRYKPSRDIYYYNIGAKICADMLTVIRPFLVVKGEQADLLLQLRALMEANVTRGPLTVQDITDRVALKARITELNKRGAS